VLQETSGPTERRNDWLFIFYTPYDVVLPFLYSLEFIEVNLNRFSDLPFRKKGFCG